MCRASSWNWVSLSNVSACNGVLLRSRRVHVVKVSGASKTASAGCSVARWIRV